MNTEFETIYTQINNSFQSIFNEIKSNIHDYYQNLHKHFQEALTQYKTKEYYKETHEVLTDEYKQDITTFHQVINQKGYTTFFNEEYPEKRLNRYNTTISQLVISSIKRYCYEYLGFNYKKAKLNDKENNRIEKSPEAKFFRHLIMSLEKQDSTPCEYINQEIKSTIDSLKPKLNSAVQTALLPIANKLSGKYESLQPIRTPKGYEFQITIFLQDQTYRVLKIQCISAGNHSIPNYQYKFVVRLNKPQNQ